jgi:uncharacterized membrane protein YeaQ/YmgE (transglycosylase-associated protein family)
MAMNEGLKRLGQVANFLYFLGLAGATFWLAEHYTTGRWGRNELIALSLVPPLIGGMVKLFVWVLEGFFTSSSDSH